jgi:hypothetical protein
MARSLAAASSRETYSVICTSAFYNVVNDSLQLLCRSSHFDCSCFRARSAWRDPVCQPGRCCANSPGPGTLSGGRGHFSPRLPPYVANN